MFSTGRRIVAGCALALAAALVPRVEAEPIPENERRSGFDFMSRETQAMQEDDTTNPGMLWVLEGEALWSRKAGAANASCSDCHGDAKASMRGVAARYPAFDSTSGQPIDLQGRIRTCRETRQIATPFAWESRELLALTTYVAHQSRGMPAAPDPDPRLAPARERGRQLYTERFGQLNFSCAACHDDNWNRRLGTSPITQGHPTGYPLYRLEWQDLGSLQRRLRNCMIGMRAEPYAYGSSEAMALELFLMERARGMTVETPAVRP